MEKRGQLEEIGTTLEDIKWTLKYTDGCVKAVNANVKKFRFLEWLLLKKKCPGFET